MYVEDDCEPGRMRAHARLTYILTGALHRFIETSVQNNKGKEKVSISRDGFGIDSIVEDAERLLLRAQAMAAYALRLDDSGILIGGESRTGVSPSVAGIGGPRPHTARPSLQIGTHKEALATIFTFNPPSDTPPSPPLTTEEVVTASSLSQPFQDSFPEACVWPARLSSTPTSVEVIRRKPTLSETAPTAAIGDAVGLTSPPSRLPPIPSGVKIRKAVPPPSRLPPTPPTPEATQRPHSTPWLRGGDEETVVDPLTGLPAQRATGFEPGPSNRDPGPIKPNPYRNLPTRPQPISRTQLINTDSSDRWATQELPVPPSNSSIESQDSSRVSGQSASSPAYPSFPSYRTPGAGCSRPPSYAEFDPYNAMEENTTPSIKEGEQTKKGSLKHFFKAMRRRSQKIQMGADGALAQRLQDEEDQVFFTMNLTNQIEDPIESTAGNISTMSDRLLAQHLQETEELTPRGLLTQASRSSNPRGGSLRQATAADDPPRWIALQKGREHSGVRGTATGQQQNEWEEDHRSTTNLEAVRESLIEQTSVPVGHVETPRNHKTIMLATLPEKEDRMEAALKAARALQAELDEEARQQDIRTLKELQAKFEEEEYQDARLAAKLAVEWEKEDRQEIERMIREQESTCIMCVERYEQSELSTPCSDKQHIWCRKCLHAGFKTALKTKSRLRCCRNIGTQSLPTLDPSFVKQYNLMLLEMDTPNPMYCSAQACGSFIPPAKVKGDIGTCAKCKKRSCLHCKAGEHPGQICAQDEDTQRVLRLAETEKWKQCPGCRNMIEKTEGCLHMTCSRCRGEFCYHCGQLWSKCKNQCSRGFS